MFISTFRYKPEYVACPLCTEYRKDQGCTLSACPWLAERIEAECGVSGGGDGDHAPAPAACTAPARFNHLFSWKPVERRAAPGAHGVRQGPPGLLPAQGHPGLLCRPVPADLQRGAVEAYRQLLYRQGFEPAYTVLGGISPHDYALFSAAKGLYHGAGSPVAMDLADRILWTRRRFA